jgi:hypothetical protein
VLQYLTHALELKDSYKLLKPHVEGLLVQVRAPLWRMCAACVLRVVTAVKRRRAGMRTCVCRCLSGGANSGAATVRHHPRLFDVGARSGCPCSTRPPHICASTLALVAAVQVVLPHLCFDDQDAELWEEDPQEFVRKVRRHHLVDINIDVHVQAE